MTKHKVLARSTIFALLAILPAALPVVSAASVEARGSVQTFSRIKTDDNVVFITIDDGFNPTAAAAQEIRDWHWPVTVFAIGNVLWRANSYFRDLGPLTSFGNHTNTHPLLTKLSDDAQRQEVCAGAAAVKAYSGVSTTYLRPPGGLNNNATYSAAAACGMRFMVLWRVSVNGTRIDTWGGPIHKGDIILMHFRPDLAASLVALKAELDRLGLKPAPLNWYLPPIPHPPVASLYPPARDTVTWVGGHDGLPRRAIY